MSTADGKEVYQAGTLTYSLKKLLLSGALVMASRLALLLVSSCLIPLLKPLLLDKAGANAAQIALIIGTIPSILNAVLCPIISTISDKTRTKWGRRTPYLLFSAPVLGGIVVLIGFYQEIAAFLTRYLIPNTSANVPLIILSVLIILFQIAFLFPGSVVYYLEADIIPQKCFGRYMAIASIFSSAASACFGYFATQYVELHTKSLLAIFAFGYVSVYVLQALFAREGEYPPVKNQVKCEGNLMRRLVKHVVTYFRQCFSYKIYIALALCSGLNTASNVCRSMYNLLFATKDLGVSLELFGKITSVSGVVSAILVYFAGKLMDRTHPMLIYFLGGILVIFINAFGYFFAIGPKSYSVVAVITALVYAFQSLAAIPLLARIFPRDKFGQFCSGNSLVTHIVMIGATAFGGVVTQIYGYRIMFVWDFIVTILAMLALYVVFSEWKRFGGKNYKAPEVE